MGNGCENVYDDDDDDDVLNESTCGKKALIYWEKVDYDGVVSALQGELGPPVVCGKRGLTGERVEQVPEGKRGKDGYEGEGGEQGPEGKRGKDGPEGKRGKDGPEGKHGERGPPGLLDDNKLYETICKLMPSIIVVEYRKRVYLNK